MEKESNGYERHSQEHQTLNYQYNSLLGGGLSQTICIYSLEDSSPQHAKQAVSLYRHLTALCRAARHYQTVYTTRVISEETVTVIASYTTL